MALSRVGASFGVALAVSSENCVVIRNRKPSYNPISFHNHTTRLLNPLLSSVPYKFRPNYSSRDGEHMGQKVNVVPNHCFAILGCTANRVSCRCSWS
jgi:hypothetical protein